MAKRRSKTQIKADKIIKAELLKLGNKIWNEATDESRVAKDTYYKDGSINRAGGSLRDTQNYRVYNDTNLKHWQMIYGKWNYPKGEFSGEKNALVIAVKKFLPESTKIIVSDLTSKIIDPFKNKK